MGTHNTNDCSEHTYFPLCVGYTDSAWAFPCGPEHTHEVWCLEHLRRDIHDNMLDHTQLFFEAVYHGTV